MRCTEHWFDRIELPHGRFVQHGQRRGLNVLEEEWHANDAKALCRGPAEAVPLPG